MGAMRATQRNEPQLRSMGRRPWVPGAAKLAEERSYKCLWFQVPRSESMKTSRRWVRAAWARCIGPATRGSSGRWRSRCCPPKTMADDDARDSPAARGAHGLEAQPPQCLHHLRGGRGRRAGLHRHGAGGGRSARATLTSAAGRTDQSGCCVYGAQIAEALAHAHSPRRRAPRPQERQRRHHSRRAEPRSWTSAWPSG